jgi:hypothetical protein
VKTDKGGRRMQKIEGVSELDVFRAMILADIERGANLLHFFLGS